MAASVSLVPAPGLTIETSLSVSVTGSGYSTILASTTSQPTFAKNIAYDEFGNPFISVVQDGRGNVFFDGGFPKYYNTNWSAAYTSYNVLPNQWKLMFNALKWCSENRATPTKRVLFFGDAPEAANYSVKSTRADGFNTSIAACAALAGFATDIVDFTNYARPSVIPYATLAQYDVVIFMSSMTTDYNQRLAASTLADIATYRQQGGGVMIITDHDVFQTLANEVAGQFNCSFSGNVDRHPVSVDALVATYGMHPLWANMTGNVPAGGSEGIVTIPSMTPFNPATDRLTITGPGYRTVYLTIVDTAGVVTTYAYSYAMNVPEPVSGIIPTATSYKFLDLPFEIIRLNNTDTSGTITVDGTLIGSFVKRLNVPVVKTFTNNSFPLPLLATNKKTVSVSVRITSPVIYDKTYQVALTPVNITSMSPAKRWASMRQNEMAAIGPKGKLIRNLQNVQGLAFTGGSNADAAQVVNNYYSTHYRTAGERVAIVGGWIDNGSFALQNWGYDSRGAGYGTIDSQTPIFSNQIVCYFANFTDRASGISTFSVAFRRSDNATQVIGNFAGRRVRLADKNGTIFFDEEVSTANYAQPDTVAGYNTFQFNWTIPTSPMRTSGATWRIQVV
ncbi:hypothetical protein D3C75_588520 [compost metagenome]